MLACYSSRLREDVSAIENVYNALLLDYNNLLEEKFKMEKLLDSCHKQLEFLNMDNSRQEEINNRLENLIMSLAPCLPPEEQFKLSNAVYVAKQFNQEPQQQLETSDCDGGLERPKDPTASEDLIDSKALIRCQPSSKANQQQAIVTNMIQLLQSLASQVEPNGASSNGGPTAERKKPPPKRRPAAAKKTSKNTSTNTKENPSTGINSQRIPATEVRASPASASQVLKQKSMFDYFGKRE